MTGIEGAGFQDMTAIAGIENQVASTLVRASGEIARSECFDLEQRAEIYAILEALKADSEVHRALIASLQRKLGPQVPDA